MTKTFRAAPFMAMILLAGVLAACTTPQAGEVGPDGVFDPFEANNRTMHAVNKGLDRAVLRPVSKGLTFILPDPVEDSLVNFSRNLSEPGDAVNFLLQGRLPEAGRSVGRFLFNTTFGLFGLFDGATEIGIAPTDTDFGETLHVWGVGEGAYVELPIFGPSTERDAVGIIVDIFTNPLSLTLTLPLDNPGLYANAVERTIQRGQFANTIDSILYDSADSYAQSRLVFLQARRFELGGSADDIYSDPYADPLSGGDPAVPGGVDPYDDPFADPYLDPYEDPYAQ
jgi:phospholipid-binding lipoprotein MlaA